MERREFVKSAQCESCPPARTTRARQTEFAGVEIISASAAGGTVTIEVEVDALPLGSATGELRAVAEQDGGEIGSVSDTIQQTKERAGYVIELPVTPVEGSGQAQASVTVDLRDDGQTVDTASTRAELDLSQAPGDGGPECVELTVVEGGSGGGDGPADGGEGGLNNRALAAGVIGLGAVAVALRRRE